MKKMASKIPNNFIYIDKHLGHDFSLKEDCLIGFMDSFFGSDSTLELEEISQSSLCQDLPVIK